MADKHNVPLKQPIAIVGIAADLPSGSYSDRNLDYRSFIEFLHNEGQSYEEIPKERLNIQSWKGEALGRIATTKGSFLKHIDAFDHVEFGLSAKDARAMAPSTRKLIELSFLAFLDSGIDYRGRNVGCYAAATAHDVLSIAEPDEFEAKGSFAGIPCMVANKISYHLDLRGPSIPIDTACSSSLTALHLAVQALRLGECESAVVAGCQLNLRLADFVQYSQGSVLARDGKCKPFDANADGFSRGEGAVAIVVKLLEDAIQDGDYIYGAILGTGINASGAIAPAYAPVGSAQAQAMRRAYDRIQRDPRDVDFIEMHATGTAAGDPAESNWIGEEFGRESDLLVGSVKGNVGHLEIAAFLVSLCKVCSILETGIVPPNVNLSVANPAIKWDQHKLRVPLQATAIMPRSSSGNLLISISSSGIGGANGHVVVESAPRRTLSNSDEASGPVLIVIGGLSPRSSASIAENLAIIATNNRQKLRAISTIHGRRTRQMTWRTSAVIRDPQNKSDVQFPSPVLAPRKKPPIVFLFSGQGPQHLNMGRELFRRFPGFRQTILELDACHREITGHSLIEQTGLFADVVPPHDLPSIWPIATILPSLAMLQMALYDLLCNLGLRPDVVIGHSAGETPLLYASGAASKAMAMDIAIARGRALSHLENANGAMAALACGPTDAHSIIAAASQAVSEKGILEIACFNAPQAVAIAGHASLVDKAIDIASSRGFLARKIQTPVPIHSSLMDLCQEQYISSIGQVFTRHRGPYFPKVATYSTVTGQALESFSEQYFWQNSRNPVQFVQAVRAIRSAYPGAVFVEISPHPVLSTYLQELGVSPPAVLCPMRRSRTYATYQEEEDLLHAVGQAVINGYNSIDFLTLNGQRFSDHGVELAPYPFAKKPVPYLPEHSHILKKQMGPTRMPLYGMDLRINALTHPDIAQHVINGEPIMPAAGFLEMALETGAKVLWNVNFRTMLSLSSETPIPVEVKVDHMKWSVATKLTSPNPVDSREVSRLHAEGCMSYDFMTDSGCRSIDIGTIRGRCEERDATGFYADLQYFAQYGPAFRRIMRFYSGVNEALLEVRGLTEDLSEIGEYVIHPAILDACIHVVVHPEFTANADRSVYYLPSSLGAFILHKDQRTFPHTVYSYALLKEWLPDELITDVYVADIDGTILCTLRGLVVKRHRNLPDHSIDKRLELILQPFDVFPLTSACPETCEKDPLRMSSSHSSSHSATDYLLDACKYSLDHIIHVSHKKVIRILGVEQGSETLHGPLCSMLEATYGSRATIVYFAWTKDPTSVNLPPMARSMELDFSASLEVEMQPRTLFDLIVVSQIPSSRGERETRALFLLTTLLLPGGMIILGMDEGVEFSPHLLPSPNILQSYQDDVGNLPAPDVASCCDIPRSQDQWSSLFSTLGLRIVFHSGSSYRFVIMGGQSASLALMDHPVPFEHKGVQILDFCVGGEMDIQRCLKCLDSSQFTHIWFVTSDGPHADGARGFSRSLRREFPQWDIGLATFESACPRAKWPEVIQLLLAITGMEREVYIDSSYKVFVPRFYDSPGPVSPRNISMGEQDNLLPGHVSVEVLSCSGSDGYYGVVGRVLRVSENCDNGLLNALICTVTLETPSDHVYVHSGALTTLPERTNVHAVASTAPSLLIAGMVFGIRRLQKPAPQYSGRLIVTHSDSRMGQMLIWFCNTLGLKPITLPCSAPPMELFLLQPRACDTVVTGYDDVGSFMETKHKDSPRVFHWKCDVHLAHTLASDPWLVGDILRVANDIVRGKYFPEIEVCDHARVSPIMSPAPLFKSNTTYLLLGGIGSLGVHVCLWMYERGARHIIMTSRSGRHSLERAKDVLALRMLEYLDTRPDISLKLVASDAASSESLQQVLANVVHPIAGCMLLSGVLSDRSFFAQDEASFDAVFRPKVRAFEALEKSLQIEQLDFLVVFSSIATFGNEGQTNYSSANTILDGKVSRYKNAFSIVAPAITDTVSMRGRPDLDYKVSRFQHLTSWAYSARELCLCLEDGISKLTDGAFNLYIPDLRWDLVEKFLGPSPLYNHLVPPLLSGSGPSGQGVRDSIQAIVLEHLGIAPENFSPDVPFTSYGIDSLSAGRLSFALRPHLAVTSMQLLGDVSLSDLEIQMERESHVPNADHDSPTVMFEWDELNQSGQSLVKLLDYGDTPLILVHGASGNILPFLPLQHRMTSSLWALQITPETPVHSIEAMAHFYFEEIKYSQPKGPYRIGAYSGTSLVAFIIAKKLQDEGDQVVQLAILDHFPLLYTSPYMQLDDETISLRSPGPAMLRRLLESMLVMYRAETSPIRHRLAKEFEDAADGGEVPPYMQIWWHAFSSIAIGVYEFIFDLLPPEQPYSEENLRDALVRWLGTINAPVSLFIASSGVSSGIPEEDRGSWVDFGLRRVYPEAQTVLIEGSHFTIFDSEDLAMSLQCGY